MLGGKGQPLSLSLAHIHARTHTHTHTLGKPVTVLQFSSSSSAQTGASVYSSDVCRCVQEVLHTAVDLLPHRWVSRPSFCSQVLLSLTGTVSLSWVLSTVTRRGFSGADFFFRQEYSTVTVDEQECCDGAFESLTR